MSSFYIKGDFFLFLIYPLSFARLSVCLHLYLSLVYGQFVIIFTQH